MKQVLFLDVDGVLLDWFPEFLKFIHASRGISPTKEMYDGGMAADYSLAPLGAYSIEKHPVYRGREGDMGADIASFGGTLAWGRLPALDHRNFNSNDRTQGATSIAKALSSLKNMGVDLHVVSQVGASPQTRLKRVSNLTALFGPVFSSISFTRHGESKVEKMGEVINSHYAEGYEMEVGFVEDAPHQLNDLLKVDAINTFGVMQEYNLELQAENNSITWIKDVACLPAHYANRIYS